MACIIVSGLELTIPKAEERLRMGGPYTGDTFLDSELIAKDCVVDNFVYQENTGFLFFVKYHDLNYFTINFYDVNNKKEYEFDRQFSIVHIGHFVSDTKLQIYPAFHAEFKNIVQIFDFDQENFTLVE